MAAIRLLPVLGTFATGTLTLADNALNTKASGTLTLTGNAGNTETVTIDTKVYTFQTVLTNVNGHVLIGASASDSIDNLIAAITLGAGSGTTYAAATTAHPSATAAAGAGDTMTCTALVGGTGGNSIATTETLANGSWGDVTLLGGVTETVVIGAKTYTWKTVLLTSYDVLIGANASDSCDNLIAAINGAAGAGTTYGTGTVASTEVYAAAGAGDTVVVTAWTEGQSGVVATTETMANGSWAAAVLTGGGATTSAAPSDLTSTTIGVQLPNQCDEAKLLLWNVDAVAGTTKTATGTLWAYHPYSGRWAPLGVINGGAAVAEAISDKLSYVELIVGLRGFTRAYFQIGSLGGAGTEIQVALDCVPADTTTA